MIRISNIKLDYKSNIHDVLKAASKKLRISAESIKSYKIHRKSIDARKGQIQVVYTIDIQVPNEDSLLKKFSKEQQIQKATQNCYSFPTPGTEALEHPPIIVGTGPAGLFCGLMLARSGYRPILLERGMEVHQRKSIVDEFWTTRKLNPNCNVQFGEGGAGTFSDGKLNTMVKDKTGRNTKVLEIFHEAGAFEEILYLNKPHIGTDILMKVVENIRNEIISLGGQVFFDSQVTDIHLENDHVKSIEVNHNKLMETNLLILAIGHSARDTFQMLKAKHLLMTPKAFAIGVRVEHLQKTIDHSQFGRPRDAYLPAADYKLTHTCENGRGVYTFCMCPGGYVVNASSEEQATAVNGMSYSDRGSQNANSAVIVTVTPEDFDFETTKDPLCGMYFQQKWEKACYNEAMTHKGAGLVPIQRFADFKNNTISTAYGHIQPVHKGDVIFANVRNCLPGYVCDSITEGLHAFGTKIKGFDHDDTLLSGIESRTSSPVRMERDENFESNIKGIYPCGEGAGYAGGITSAAMDGLRIAEAIVGRYAKPNNIRKGSDL